MLVLGCSPHSGPSKLPPVTGMPACCAYLYAAKKNGVSFTMPIAPSEMACWTAVTTVGRAALVVEHDGVDLASVDATLGVLEVHTGEKALGRRRELGGGDPGLRGDERDLDGRDRPPRRPRPGTTALATSPATPTTAPIDAFDQANVHVAPPGRTCSDADGFAGRLGGTQMLSTSYDSTCEP